jgi:hypothetical protein
MSLELGMCLQGNANSVPVVLREGSRRGRMARDASRSEILPPGHFIALIFFLIKFL